MLQSEEQCLQPVQQVSRRSGAALSRRDHIYRLSTGFIWKITTGLSWPLVVGCMIFVSLTLIFFWFTFAMQWPLICRCSQPPSPIGSDSRVSPELDLNFFLHFWKLVQHWWTHSATPCPWHSRCSVQLQAAWTEAECWMLCRSLQAVTWRTPPTTWASAPSALPSWRPRPRATGSSRQSSSPGKFTQILQTWKSGCHTEDGKLNHWFPCAYRHTREVQKVRFFPSSFQNGWAKWSRKKSADSCCLVLQVWAVNCHEIKLKQKQSNLSKSKLCLKFNIGFWGTVNLPQCRESTVQFQQLKGQLMLTWIDDYWELGNQLILTTWWKWSLVSSLSEDLGKYILTTGDERTELCGSPSYMFCSHVTCDKGVNHTSGGRTFGTRLVFDWLFPSEARYTTDISYPIARTVQPVMFMTGINHADREERSRYQTLEMRSFESVWERSDRWGQVI